MPYTKSPRPYKHEYQMQLKRDEHAQRAERQRARRAIDKKYKDDPRDKDRTAEVREGKDIAHVRALDKGGSNKDGLRIESAAKNRSFKRDSNHNLVSEVSKKERAKRKK